MKLLPIVRKMSGNNRFPETITVEIMAYAKVDDDLFDYLNQFRWTFGCNGYPKRKNKERKDLWLHREAWEMAGRAIENELDHIDGDRLNAQLSNLRDITHRQNSANRRRDTRSRSGFKGVSWHKRIKKWNAYIRYDYALVSLGYFHDPKEAALAYDAKAIELFGEYAKTNKMLGLI
jgi:hypothetical protein